MIKRFMMTLTQPWWQSAVFYQIYPRSFADSNDDGVGDLEGIRQRLSYLQWLGIDAVLISPFFPSPMEDFGYDITDYCNVDPVFGSLKDFDQLLAEAHDREMRVILDLVPNHTSIEHPWFKESRRSCSSSKRDWYIWHPGKSISEPPNNWECMTGGNAWSWDTMTGQFYLHSFLPCQPDLNWRHPGARDAVLAGSRR
jgi:alpha-glucosidase